MGGQLNPDWVDWLMGFPEGWTDIDRECKADFSVLPPMDWPDEPEGVPRVTRGSQHRVDRLKGDGNAVVWRQFYPIFAAIYDISTTYLCDDGNNEGDKA